MDKLEKSYKFWDRVSGWSKAESTANGPLVDHIYGQFGINILPDDKVLDFGCGTGTISLLMAQYTDKVFGVDVSEGMLKHARQNIGKSKIDNAAFLKIETLGEMFPPEFFSLITAFNVLQYIEDRAELLQQFNKLLEPEGKLIIAVPCFGSFNSLSTLLVRFLRFVHIMPKTYFFGGDEIGKEITDAGFSIIESINLSSMPEKLIVARKS